MKYYTKRIVGSLLSLIAGTACAQVLHLSFEDNTNLQNYGVRPIEYVTGVKGNAIRTDGYSTYAIATADVSRIDPSQCAFSLWCAPQTYPMMNANEAETIPSYACIVGNIDDVQKTGFAFELSSQGNYRFRCYANGWETVCQANDKMPLAKWSHLTAVRQGRNIILYNNAQEVGRCNIAFNINVGNQQFYIGKSREEKKVWGVFHINTFNGLIDDFEVTNSVPASSQLLGSNQEPNLHIPASRFEHSILRPVFHGMPEANWTNETHGLTWYHNKYHIFFQKNANGPYMARLHWGHLSSTDLIHWQEEPIALVPDMPYDIKGCWSGAMMFVNNEPHILYTGVDNARATINEAQPNDTGLISWSKNSNNPIINGRPPGLSDDFRDPYFFENNGQKYIIVGTSKNGIGAMTLHRWNPTGWSNDGTMFFQGTNANVDGVFWEMPTVTKMGNQWLVTATPLQTGKGVQTLYWTGNILSDGTFQPNNKVPQELELSGMNHDGYGLLSPSIVQKDNRTILMGIVPDKLPAEANYQLGWAHTYGLPREISLDDKGHLLQRPVKEIQNIRTATTVTKENFYLQDTYSLAPVKGRQWEVKATFVVGSASFGLHFLKNNKGKATLLFNPQEQTITANFTSIARLVNDKGTYEGQYSGKLPQNIAVGDTLTMHVFFDHSILDIFINNSYACSMRVFATDNDADDVELFSEGSTLVKKMTAWTLDGRAITTQIPMPQTASQVSATAYKLDGTAVKTPYKNGVYIINGKKIVKR